jgi:putative hydrolase of the HAD superfamily
VTIDVVLFDLGGVVCRFDPSARLAALAHACGVDAATVHTDIFDSGFDRDSDRGIHSAHDVLRRLRSLGFRGSIEELGSLWTRAFQPDEQVLALVRQARQGRRRTALLTDNGQLLLDALPVRLPSVAEAFDAYLFSCTLGAVKPDPAVFDAALDRLGATPASAFFVDDSPRNVAAARAAGLHAEVFRDAAALARTLRDAGLIG